MKPPRVTIRSNHYVLRGHIPGQKNAVDRPTGIEADHKDWKKSRSVKLIRAKIQEFVDWRDKNLKGKGFHPTPNLTWKELLEAFNKKNEVDRDKPLSPKTLVHRRNAVDFLLKWKNLLPCDFDREQALELRQYGKTTLQPKSLKGYFGVYQTLMKYAATLGIQNEVAGIRISAPKKEVRIISEEDLKTVVTFLYHKNRPFMDQVFFLALSMWRVGEGCRPKTDQLEPDGIHYLNTKVGRKEIQPVTEAMEFTLTGDYGGFVFKLRSERNVAYYLQRACQHAKECPLFTPHDLKRYGVQALAKRGDADPRTFELAVHHAPTTAQTAMDHYAGRDLYLIKQALENTHAVWLPFIQNLPHTYWDDKVYSFTNLRGKRGKDRGKEKGHL